VWRAAAAAVTLLLSLAQCFLVWRWLCVEAGRVLWTPLWALLPPPPLLPLPLLLPPPPLLLLLLPLLLLRVLVLCSSFCWSLAAGSVSLLKSDCRHFGTVGSSAAAAAVGAPLLLLGAQP
jgi:hypothetical protein